jgi:hypothetical protein
VGLYAQLMADAALEGKLSRGEGGLGDDFVEVDSDAAAAAVGDATDTTH